MHTSTRHARCALLSALAIQAALIFPSAHAANQSWIGGSGDWTDPAHWSTAMPGAGDNALIIHSDALLRTVNYTYAGAPITLGTLTVDNTLGGITTLSQPANALTVTSEIIAGAGVASVNLAGGGHTVMDGLTLGDLPNASGAFSISGGALTALANAGSIGLTIGKGGSGFLSQTAGTVFIGSTGDPADLLIGSSNTATGTYSIENGADAIVNGRLVVGVAGVGAFTQSDGTTVTLGGPLVTGDLTIAEAAGSKGTYTLNDGILSSPFETIGLNGDGKFVQNGGVNQTQVSSPGGGGTFTVGRNPTALGTYILTGGTLTSGGEVFGFDGPAVMTHSGGTNSLGSLIIGLHATAPSIYTLSGTGLVFANNVYVGGNSFLAGGGTSTLSITGGSMTVSGTLKLWNGGTLLMSGTGKLILPAAAFIVAATASPADSSAKAATLAAYINTAAANNWTGPGITSTSVANDSTHNTTLGVFDNADLHFATYNNAALSPTDLLITRALLGDCDLNIIVDALDFDAWFKHVGSINNFRTSQGDYDRSGIIDAVDFDIWFKHVGLSGLPLIPTSAPVPEPTTLLLTLPAALLLLRKRKPL